MTISDNEPERTPIFDSTRQNFDEPDVVGAEPPVGSTFLTGSDESGSVDTTDATVTQRFSPGTFDTSGTDRADNTDGPGKTDVAKDEAARVADSAKDAAADVAEVAKSEAATVAHETQRQAKQLYHQTQSELREQAAVQQQRVADGLRSIGDELQQMARSSDQQGVASDLVGQAGDRTQRVARWLDERDPGSLLQEVKSYARRNPGTFIAAAALTGVLAGRLTRALASGGDDSGTGGSTTTGGSATGSTTSTGAAAPRIPSAAPVADPTAPVPGTAVPNHEGYLPGGTMGGSQAGGPQ